MRTVLIRQSDIKLWQRCALQYRFAKIDQLPEEIGSAAPFGTILHESIFVLENTESIESAKRYFRAAWASADIDYFLPRTSYTSYLDKGLKILDDWWAIQQWHSSKVLVREHTFEVPLGRHTLTGTIDRLDIRYLSGGPAIVVQDYKTNAKLPTRDYLRHDVQFTAYSYATTIPEFWKKIPDGERLFEVYRDVPRMGEWVALTQGPKRVTCGERLPRDYRRLEMTADAMEQSIAMGIFVPTLRGDVCEFCSFRKPCGLSATKEEE